MHIQNKGVKDRADAKKIFRETLFKITIDQSYHIYQGDSRFTDYKRFNKKAKKDRVKTIKMRSFQLHENNSNNKGSFIFEAQFSC